MRLFKNYIIPAFTICGLLFVTSCKKEEEEKPTDEITNPTFTPGLVSDFDYEFNNGQVVATGSYDGNHSDELLATMRVEELSGNQTKITVTLTNTIWGEIYHVHAHDAADPATTPNGTPYNETPNADVFSQEIHGIGGIEVSAHQIIDQPYNDVINNYNGYLVVHDPFQPMSTTNLSTYLVLGTFARPQAASNLASESFQTFFNTGQVDPAYAYAGTHPNTLKSTLKIQELADGRSRVSVLLNFSQNGETYMVHAHDFADPATTPNGTPYNETPNAGVCTLMITGNGGSARAGQISNLSIDEITTMYEGFFVVHDPFQAISTTDPTTYVLLSQFARN